MNRSLLHKIVSVHNRRSLRWYGMIGFLALTISFSPKLPGASAPVIDDRYTRIFPKRDCETWEKHTLCWATDRLLEAGEKAIRSLTTSSETHYRVLHYQWGNRWCVGAFCVHITVASPRRWISYSEWRRTEEGLRLQPKSTATLSEKDISMLKSLLEASDFWKLPYFPPGLTHFDPSPWYIEVVQDGKYRMVFLESDSDGKMRKFCSEIRRLAEQLSRIKGPTPDN